MMLFKHNPKDELLLRKLARFGFLLPLVWGLLACTGAGQRADLDVPAEFVDIQSLIPTLVLDVRYASSDNFVGRPITGYQAEKIYLTRAAGAALVGVQAELASKGMSLKLFDGYRPQRAVDHFVRWAQDLDDTRMQEKYYPAVVKQNLFSEGYIAERSGHTRGSTVDLTIVERASNKELDMGGPWDFFDPISWPSSNAVSADQFANRMLLQDVMQRHGFKPLDTEWWHFTLQGEPFPDRYFDFVIR